ncbi:MAG: methyl-accepting chemotaxis protein [Bacillota bacterium]
MFFNRNKSLLIVSITAITGSLILSALVSWGLPSFIALAVNAAIAGITVAALLNRDIRHDVNCLGSEAEKLARGKVGSINKKKTYRKEFEGLASVLGDLASLLKDITIKVQTASGQVFAAVEQLSLTTDASRQAAANFSRVEEVAGTLADLSGELKRESEENERALTACSKDMDNARRAIEQLRNESMQVANHVSILSESVGRVDTILDTIVKISDQTRLLALNAAIEAARSGQEGRGFAVVAQEVKKLSENTYAATHEITEIITSIRREVKLVEEKVSSAKESVVEGVSSTLNAQSGLESIAAAVEAISSTVQKSSGEVSEYLHHVNIAAMSQKDNFDKIIELGEILQRAAAMMEETGRKIQIGESGIKESEKFLKRADSLLAELQKLSSIPRFGEMNPIEHEKVLTEFLKSQSDLEAIWSNRMDGTFVYSNPPAGLANARAREWWKQAAQGKEYISEIYVSAITQNPCVTLSVPVIDDMGNTIGVTGADLHL